MIQHRRRVPRYAFSAVGEVIDGSGAEMRTRVADISLGGCRLLANGKLPVGMTVTVKIHTSSEYFESSAKVMYSTPNDMGVMFQNVDHVFFPVLHKWIHAAIQDRIAVP